MQGGTGDLVLAVSPTHHRLGSRCVCAADANRYLSLAGEGLVGAFPSVVWNLPEIVTLIVDNTQFSSTHQIPDSIGALTALQYVTAADGVYSTPCFATPFKSCVHSFSPACTRVLVLSSSDFTGTIPDTIGNLTRLALLDISNNALTGTLPDGVGDLVALTYCIASSIWCIALLASRARHGSRSA